MTLNKNIFGRDIHKPYRITPVPESLGIVPGTIFLICGIMLQLIFKEYKQLNEINAGLTSIGFML